MGDTEERLTEMGRAVASMQATIDIITNKRAHEHNTLADSIDALTIQLATVTTALQHTTRLLSTTRRPPRGLYEPWTEEHEALLTHKYVAREVMTNVLLRTIRTVDNFHTGWRTIHNLLDTMPSHLVSRRTRFPPHGLYINVHNFNVFHLIQELKEHSYGASAEASQGRNTSKFTEVFSQLKTLALSNVGSGRTVGMIHDRASFEEEYKLQWVERTPEVVEDEFSEGTGEDEVTITGISTPV